MTIHLKANGLENDVVLWRYMDVGKFISMLQKEIIWLARADTFVDKHEGRFPEEMRGYIEKAYENMPSNDESPVRDAIDFQDYLVKNTFISCWHKNTEESMVMWSMYGKDQNSVAIQTTADSLKKSVNPALLSGNSLWLKEVLYENADAIDGVLRYEDCFFRKRRHFSFEKEVRISLDTYSKEYPSKKTPVGYELNVSMDTLIHKILVHPDSKPWFLDAIKSVSAIYKLKAVVDFGVFGYE